MNILKKEHEKFFPKLTKIFETFWYFLFFDIFTFLKNFHPKKTLVHHFFFLFQLKIERSTLQIPFAEKRRQQSRIQFFGGSSEKCRFVLFPWKKQRFQTRLHFFRNFGLQLRRVSWEQCWHRSVKNSTLLCLWTNKFRERTTIHPNNQKCEKKKVICYQSGVVIKQYRWTNRHNFL